MEDICTISVCKCARVIAKDVWLRKWTNVCMCQWLCAINEQSNDPQDVNTESVNIDLLAFYVYLMERWEERDLILWLKEKKKLLDINANDTENLSLCVNGRPLLKILLKKDHFTFKVVIKGQFLVKTLIFKRLSSHSRLMSMMNLRNHNNGETTTDMRHLLVLAVLLLGWQSHCFWSEVWMTTETGSLWIESWTCYTILVSLFLLRASCRIPRVAGQKTKQKNNEKQ